MRIVQILGTGSAESKKLVEMAERAADELMITCKIEEIDDEKAAMSHGVLVTPAIIVDGKTKASGRMPTYDEIKGMLA